MKPIFSDTPEGRIEQLVTEYRRDACKYLWLGRLDNGLAYTAFALTIAATAVASFGAFNKWDSGIVGTASLVPGIVALAITAWKPQDRANWHFEKCAEIEALVGRLRHQLPLQPTADNVAAISKARAELDKKMNAAWKKELKLSFSAFTTRSRY